MAKKIDNLDSLAIATLRSLAIDEINQAKSGHPGVALDAAPMLYTLYRYHLISDPNNPNWINRDRFILSSGHASSLMYAILHLFGYKVSLDDLKNFRQLGSITTGHPEYKVTEGVDASSGPLGQGLAQAVGVALAETMLASKYPEGNKLIDHYTYCMLGDGDLSEGISQEAISFAGLQRLNKLIVLYDSNNVTLDGPLGLSFNEDVELRFLASNWNVIKVKDGNNVNEINKAITKAKKSKNYPTLIIVNTIIGYGSKNQGTCKVHGAPLGEEDGEYAKSQYNFKHEKFYVPNEVKKMLNDTFVSRGKEAYKEYCKVLTEYKKLHSKEYEIFNDGINCNVDKYFKNYFDKLKRDNSTRNTSGEIINLLSKDMPFLVAGASDVSKSVMTRITDGGDLNYKNRCAKNINFGIREFLMGSVANGILLHQGFKQVFGSFLVFSDYLKPALRISALSKLPVIYAFTHDSIYVGEDGPTHQPIEQLVGLRSIPNVNVIRPCDSKEVLGAYKVALNSKETPTCLILTRQGVKTLDNSNIDSVKQGAYIIDKEKTKKFITIIASGSEVNLAIEAKKLLAKNKIDVRVVSMPCMELFSKLPINKQNAILGADYNNRIAVEMLSTFGWHKYAKYVYGIDSFGVSGKGDVVAKFFKFTSVDLAKKIKSLFKK